MRYAREARAAALAAALATGCATQRTTSGPHEGPASASSDASAEATEAGSADDEPTLDAAEATEAGATTAPDAGADLALYDDFESAAVGGPPNPALWTVVSPDCSGTGTLAIDDSEAHSGHHSVRVDGGGGYCDHVFFSNASAIAGLGDGGQVYARFFVRLGEALGQGHVSFLAMEDLNDGDDDVRMGGQDAILMYNRESDDATLPTLSPTGVGDSVVIPSATWTCIEFHIDETGGTIDTWVNGAEVPGLVENGTAVADISTEWLSKTWRPSLATFQLGWESYAGETMTLWFDDVALASFRVGCGSGTGAALPLAGTLDGG